MNRNGEQNVSAELSRAIDALNNKQPYQPLNAEARELAKIAALVKESACPEIPGPVISSVVDYLAAELHKQPRSSRKKWLYSGIIGAAAVAVLALALPLPSFRETTPGHELATRPPVLSENPAGVNSAVYDSAPSLPHNTDENDKPAGNNEAKPSSGSSALDQRAAAVKQENNEIASPAEITAQTANNDTKRQPGLYSLLNRSAQPGDHPDNTTIRQIFSPGTKDEIIVTKKRLTASSAKIATAEPEGDASRVAPRRTGMAKTGPSADTQPASPIARRSELNKVTIITDQYEVTVEGRQPQDELLKVAEAALKQPD